MKRLTNGMIVLIAIVLMLPQNFSCKKIDLQREILVTTDEALIVTFNTANLSGEIVDAGEDNSFSTYGFVYSGTNNNPTVSDEKAVAGNSWRDGVYQQTISGLSSNTTYYFRSYVVKTDGEPVYGNLVSFKTDINPNINLPTVQTLNAINITAFSATIQGAVTDDGGGDVTRKGFCISTEQMPTVDNDLTSNDGSGTGQYQHTFLDLIPVTDYYVRAYAENQKGIAYGAQVSFTTPESGGAVAEWLHYDDGNNFDGIGLTVGDTDFDAAIRFTPEQLAPYNGMTITKFRIFLRESSPIEYYVEIFEGPDPLVEDIVYDQLVESPVAGQWNEIVLDEPYTIDATMELWFGYYISNAAEGLFPAGIDAGPAESGYGDLIATGNPLEWFLLSDADVDANWNIQVFVTNQAGKDIPMTRMLQDKPYRGEQTGTPANIISAKQSSH